MYHPRILGHYSHRIIQCQYHATDSLTETGLFFGVNTMQLAEFLCTIGAIGSRRFAHWFEAA